MYHAIIVIASLLFFIFIVWFVVSYYLKKYYLPIPQKETSRSPYRLARITRKILSFFHGLSLLIIIIGLPVQTGVFLYNADDPEWKADIAVFTHLSIDQEQLPDLKSYGISEQYMSDGNMTLTTSNKLSYIFYWAGFWIYIIGSLYFTLQARNIFVSLSFGNTFTRKNSVRLKKIGFVILASQVFNPLWQYFVWHTTYMDFSFNTGPVHLSPPWPVCPDLDIVTLGLALLVFSGIVKEAKQMSDEQRLTI